MILSSIIAIVAFLLNIIYVTMSGISLPAATIESFVSFYDTWNGVFAILPFVRTLFIAVFWIFSYHAGILIARVLIGFVALVRGAGKPDI